MPPRDRSQRRAIHRAGSSKSVGPSRRKPDRLTDWLRPLYGGNARVAGCNSTLPQPSHTRTVVVDQLFEESAKVEAEWGSSQDVCNGTETCSGTVTYQP